MTITSSFLTGVAEALRGLSAGLTTVQGQGASLLAAASTNLSSMPDVWHGPRASSVLGAGEDYAMAAGGRPPRLRWQDTVGETLGIIDSWAASADEYAGYLRGPEAVLQQPVDTPEDGENFSRASDQVALHRAAWIQICNSYAADLDTYRTALDEPINSVMFGPGFPDSPPTGAAYMAAVSDFAIVADMPFSMIDPSGQLDAERRARLDGLFNSDTGNLIFTIIETANEENLGERDEHWSDDDLFAASDPEIVRRHILEIYADEGVEIDDAALDLLVTETVATALALRAGGSDDWKDRDKDLGFFDQGFGEWLREDFAGPAAAFVTTAGCMAVVTGGSSGTASVPAAGGCAALGQSVGNGVSAWANGGDLGDIVSAMTDPTSLGFAAVTGGATQGLFNRFVPGGAALAMGDDGIQLLTNGTAYEALSSAPIAGSTRAAHRAGANRYFADMLEGDAAFRQFFDDALGMDVLEYMRGGSGGTLRNPPGAVWHHPAGDPNSLILLRAEVHTMPSLQPSLHPGPNGGGGFSEFFANG